MNNFEKLKEREKEYREKIKQLKEQLKNKEQECDKLHDRTASIIYSLTGGRLSYSTYTLEGCEDAYRDQLEIDVKKATKELEEDYYCDECHNKIILDIINKVKDN